MPDKNSIRQQIMDDSRAIVSSKTFSETINFLRFPMALLVVYLHSSGDFTEDATGCIKLFFSSILGNIAVPFFFFVSGYFFFTKLHEWNWGGYIVKLKKRVGTLLIPYVLWAFVIPAIYFGIIYAARHFYNGKDFSDLWSLLSDPMKLNGPLWFLRNLIVLALASPLVYYWVTKTKIIGLIVLGTLYVADISIPVEGFEPVGWFSFLLEYISKLWTRIFCNLSANIG